MSQEIPTAAPSRTLKTVLAERGALPAKVGLAVFRQLLRQVRALHAGGATHRAVGPDTVLLDASGRATLAAAEPVRELDGADADSCPPELHRAGIVRLAADMEAARQELSRAGVALDPRRIDVYQLGALLCQLLTGQAVSAYLCSPKTKSKVPTPVQPLIERALGHNAADRFADCDAFAAAFEAAGRAPPAAAPETPSAGSAVASPNTPAGGADSPSGPSPPLSRALPFARLGHYRVDKRIGRGGMGDVYLGYEEALQRPVAIKVLPADLARDDDFVRRFHAEATAVAKLAHPNIVPIHFIGQDAGCHFFVMQYVEGESLDRLLARKGRLGVAEALGVLEQSLAGLGAAHQAGLVHRDVKPGNILLDGKTGRALVADFGLVKTAGSGGGMTATGMVLGTVDYIAPEQARGRDVDGRADLYALGVLAYQMLSGRLPFKADTPSAMLFQHAYETPTPLSEVAPETPGSLAAVVDKLMAKDPAARYQSCEDVLADLRCWRAGDPLSAGGERPAAERPSQIIPAPDWEPPPMLPFRLEAAGLWQRLRARLLDWFQARAPELVQRLQNTEQQVDGAVAEYQRRRDRLAGLMEEAAEAAGELAAQADSHREAAAASSSAPEREECERVAADLDAQAAEQQGHITRMRAQLAQVDATLGRLRSQNELLQARMRVAAARLRMEEGPARPRLLRRLVAAAVLVLVLFVVGGLFFALTFRQTATQPGVGPDAQKPIGEVRRFVGHTDVIRKLSVSPDGKQLLTAGFDKTLRVWDVATGHELLKWEGPVGEKMHGVAFLPDGKRALFCCNQDKNVHLWDLAANQEIRSFQGHTDTVWNLAVARDGRTAASCGPESTVFLWDVETGKELHRLEGNAGGVESVAFSPDGKLLLAGAIEGPIRLWNVETGKEVRRFGGHSKHVMGMAFGPDGTWAVSCSFDKTICVWRVEDGRELRRFVGVAYPVWSVAFSPDASKLLTANEDGTMRLWDAATGKELYRFPAGQQSVWQAAFSPDGRYAFSSGNGEKVVRMWRLPPVDYVPPTSLDATPVVKKPEPKPAAPDADAQAAEEEALKDLYKGESTKEDVLALADKLRQLGIDTKDKPATRFVLFRESRDLAAWAGDFGRSRRAVEEMANYFAVNVPEMNIQAVEAAARTFPTPPAQVPVAEAALRAAEEAEDADDYDMADRAIQAAGAAAHAAGSPSLEEIVAARAAEIDALRKAWEPAGAAAQTLATKPDDPDASLALGAFYCLDKGDWGRGLPLLTQGPDRTLKALAQADLDDVADPAAQMDLAKTYLSRADGEAGPRKAQFLRRACFWYQKARAQLTGISGLEVEKKIDEIEQNIPLLRPAIVCAYYGAYNDWQEVTDTVRRLLIQAKGPKLTVKADAGELGIPNHDDRQAKTLVIVYQVGGQTCLSLTSEGGTPTIPAAPGATDVDAARPGPGQELLVVAARYGAEGSWADVTAAAQHLVKGSSLTTPSDGLVSVDPAFARHKALVVVYRYGNRLRFSVTPHDQPVVVGAVPATP